MIGLRTIAARPQAFQEHWFAETAWSSFLSVACLLLCLSFLSLLTRGVKHLVAVDRHREYAEAVEDLENDVGAMVLSFAWTV